ncbi:hypothetical protein Pint_16503 [Pistacia integerrima]|uniref:Uncharacterized protein n=1 Tax=Pistacia integerrima TaxID=434235 RepID=A0ACC0ZEA2_9ROSI|nr:hypothetical protein Pint_16503 [Pistacia integerrima]
MESRRDTMLLDSNPDFEFSISSCFDQESSSADELFANGVILPVQVQDNIGASKQVLTRSAPPAVSLPPLHRPPSSNDAVKKGISVKEMLVVKCDSEDQKPQQAKSFWGFKRSCSLNHEAKKSLICSLPLLSRSNSTGSVPNNKRSSSLKDNHNHKARSSSTSTAYQKPPLKKNYVGSYGNGVKISPVLRTANLFGLGSLLRSGSKDKKNNKK